MQTRIVMGVAITALMFGCQGPVMTELGPSQGDQFTFVTIGDNRADEPITQPQAYRDCIAEINKLDPQPAIVFVVGDFILGYTGTDLKLARREWEEFDLVTRTINAPVRMAPGNHDIWNVPSYNLYRKRYGESYYSFNYGNCHFVMLNSEEPEADGTIPGKITGEQLKWLRGDLHGHRAMAHKFVFLHKPLWATHRGMESSGWNENVHPLLDKYNVDIVFAGHDHQYVNYGIKDAVQYYVTGGGGAGLEGGMGEGTGVREIGGFHHFMLTTVDGDSVSSIVVESNGDILPDTVVTDEKIEMWNALTAALTFPGVELPEGKHSVAFENEIKNPLTQAIEIRYAWDTSDTAWSIDPASGVLNIPPGGQVTLRTTAWFEPGKTMPVPAMTSNVFINGELVTPVASRFQPLIRQRGEAARVDGAPVVDGVIGSDEYGDAVMNGDFVDFRGLGVPANQTRFQLAYDDYALYVGVIADESEPHGIAIEPRERDGGVWQDDDIELFIDANFDRTTYHHFVVNTEAVQFDSIGGPEHGTFGDVKWNGDWQSAAKVGTDHFVVELAIPFETLGVAPPKAGDTWGLNICRARQATGKYSDEMEMGAWSIPYANFHVPSHFGDVTFR